MRRELERTRGSLDNFKRKVKKKAGVWAIGGGEAVLTSNIDIYLRSKQAQDSLLAEHLPKATEGAARVAKPLRPGRPEATIKKERQAQICGARTFMAALILIFFEMKASVSHGLVLGSIGYEHKLRACEELIFIENRA